jgi:hypothetical protein
MAIRKEPQTGPQPAPDDNLASVTFEGLAGYGNPAESLRDIRRAQERDRAATLPQAEGMGIRSGRIQETNPYAMETGAPVPGPEETMARIRNTMRQSAAGVDPKRR